MCAPLAPWAVPPYYCHGSLDHAGEMPDHVGDFERDTADNRHRKATPDIGLSLRFTHFRVNIANATTQALSGSEAP